MQRKAGQTRGPNAAEKRFLTWVKEQPCVICKQPGPSIADHCYGSTMRHRKVLIGMWALLPYCEHCDRIKTNGSHRAHLAAFGKTQADLWLELIEQAPILPPAEVVEAVQDWGR